MYISRSDTGGRRLWRHEELRLIFVDNIEDFDWDYDTVRFFTLSVSGHWDLGPFRVSYSAFQIIPLLLADISSDPSPSGGASGNSNTIHSGGTGATCKVSYFF